MPQTSLQEKQSSQTFCQGITKGLSTSITTTSSSSTSMTTTTTTASSSCLKRKRRNTEPSEDTDHSYPPNKKTVLSSPSSYSDGFIGSQILDDVRTPQNQISLSDEQREPSTWSELRTATCFLTPSASSTNDEKFNPLPSFSWADGSQVWSMLCMGDQKTLTQRDPLMFQRHPSLQPRMRAILLDWLIEVCEVYKLHRETYYLAMDYIDRYLSTHQNVPKNQLQLIGITCLFIAAKVEEIYPPKLADFAYITDGACTEEEILGKELIVLKGLGWNLSPVTPPGWLNVYMQLDSGDWSRPNAFIFPQYSGLIYSKAAQLIDLATLDEGSLKFPYSHMAASAIYHTQGRETALRVSRLSWEQLAPCAKWLAAFANTVAEEGYQLLYRANVASIETHSGSGLRASVPNIVLDESHRIQTHVVDLVMLEKSQQRHIQHILPPESPDNSSSLEASESPDQSGILTPPSSDQKNSSPSPPRLPLPQLEPYT